MRVPPPDAVTSSGLEPRATKGDVDINGDVVDMALDLTARLRAAVGPHIAEDICPDDQVTLARFLIVTAPLASREGAQ